MLTAFGAAQVRSRQRLPQDGQAHARRVPLPPRARDQPGQHDAPLLRRHGAREAQAHARRARRVRAGGGRRALEPARAVQAREAAHRPREVLGASSASATSFCFPADVRTHRRRPSATSSRSTARRRPSPTCSTSSASCTSTSGAGRTCCATLRARRTSSRGWRGASKRLLFALVSSASGAQETDCMAMRSGSQHHPRADRVCTCGCARRHGRRRLGPPGLIGLVLPSARV